MADCRNKSVAYDFRKSADESFFHTILLYRYQSCFKIRLSVTRFLNILIKQMHWKPVEKNLNSNLWLTVFSKRSKWQKAIRFRLRKKKEKKWLNFVMCISRSKQFQGRLDKINSPEYAKAYAESFTSIGRSKKNSIKAFLVWFHDSNSWISPSCNLHGTVFTKKGPVFY